MKRILIMVETLETEQKNPFHKTCQINIKILRQIS